MIAYVVSRLGFRIKHDQSFWRTWAKVKVYRPLGYKPLGHTRHGLVGGGGGGNWGAPRRKLGRIEGVGHDSIRPLNMCADFSFHFCFLGLYTILLPLWFM